MNSMQIKDKVKNIALKRNVDFNTVLRLYMYDRFIERLACSKYKDNFILKGGFYLSTLFGVENRSTMDIDTAVRNLNFTEDNIKKIIRDIISIDIDDNAVIELIDILPIRSEDEYGGFRVVLNVKIENMRERFQIDIATGDPITPSAIGYEYKPILGDDKIRLWAYNVETLLAEKVETILSRGEYSSRTRDYYDIYLIYTKYWDNLNKNDFRLAVENTFSKRGYKNNIVDDVKIITNSSILEKRWLAYSKKNDYANNISYEEIMDCLERIVSVISVELV